MMNLEFYSKLKKKYSLRFLLFRKLVYSNIRSKPNDKKIIFVLGCQRSGTTLLTDIFQKDMNAKIFGEFSELSSNDRRKIRLNSLSDVDRIFTNSNFPLIVAKPIVESQNALSLLNYFPQANVIWIYRNFKDVSSSNIKKFGPTRGVKDLRPIFENDPANWRSENVNDYSRQIVKGYFDESMAPEDASSLFWFIRNQIFFDLELYKENRVMLIKYEDLVAQPESTMQKIYHQIGLPYPGNKIVSSVHTDSVNKGSSIQLSKDIEMICTRLYNKLENEYIRA